MPEGAEAGRIGAQELPIPSVHQGMAIGDGPAYLVAHVMLAAAPIGFDPRLAENQQGDLGSARSIDTKSLPSP